ncbi:Uncharacterised protein [Serratia entomophila]|uniref:hypothetical protein n=1 Tax=Serratia entomophila TaxID=42906 RepID=UPI001F23021A|nr:hypothetical protein [Serratia entomophila]UIW20209.1 hypothetical protein KHA73_09840 [Serratia entomophila]CAI0776593.1 Uncharacterised protein [Serratia entomophila]CAI0794558.1 Uncharacterised protein [Serratia entomophila]CAI0806490.1 Uncharacterised protein [Serratia entomophila]CAI0814020.1 Uncharacterised protein [Serratia entomophila]
MKNSITDLMNHQFMMLETLTDPSLKGEELQEAVMRAKAVSDVAGTMIATYRVALDAQRAVYDGYAGRVPKVLGIEE